MKPIRLLLICAAIVASSTTANADLILQYDSITSVTGESFRNSGEGQLGVLNVDPAFATAPLSYIGTDGTTPQGLGSVTDVNGQNGNTATVTVGPGTDVAFAINPGGGLSGTTAASLAGGNFIFFTFDAAQALDLTELSVASDPNNGGSNFGSRTAGAFVSLDGGTTYTQFGSDFVQNNNAFRNNIFTDSLLVGSGDTVQVAFAFTNEVGGDGWTQATRIGSINVIGFAAVPEPSSSALLGIAALGFCGFRRRRS